jgi:hypothetical protein
VTITGNQPLLDGNPVFHQILDKYFVGKPDERTLRLPGEG